jgi:hypothetical protein
LNRDYRDITPLNPAVRPRRELRGHCSLEGEIQE